MNRYVNAVTGRLSLRAPQRRSLEITRYAPNGIPEFAIDAPSIITGNNYGQRYAVMRFVMFKFKSQSNQALLP